MTTHDRVAGARRGMLLGLTVGLVVAVAGEGAAAVIRSVAADADVAIAGFVAVYGLPGSTVLGALLGWWGRPAGTRTLALAAALPAGLVGIWQVTLQVLVV